jgi:hypothetical protein
MRMHAHLHSLVISSRKEHNITRKTRIIKKRAE